LTRIGRIQVHRHGAPRLIVLAADGTALPRMRGGYDHFL